MKSTVLRMLAPNPIPAGSLADVARKGDLVTLNALLAKRTNQAEVDDAIDAAASTGQAQAISMMLASGKASKRAKDSALWKAADENHAAAVEVLIPHSSDTSIPLARAVNSGCMAVIPVLVKHANWQGINKGIFYAAQKGSVEIIAMILPRTPEVLARQAMYEATKNKHWHVLPLLAQKADLDKVIKGLAHSKRWPEVDQVLALGTPQQQAKWVAHYPPNVLPISAAQVKAEARLKDLQATPATATGRPRQRI